MIGGKWVKMPCRLLNDERMTRADLCVFAYMADRLKTSSKPVKISKIAEMCELSERTVQRSLKKLEECKYIRADREQSKPTVYTQLLLPTSEEKKLRRAETEEKTEYVEEALKSILAKKVQVKSAEYVEKVYAELKAEAEVRVKDRSKLMVYLSKMIETYKDTSDGFDASLYKQFVNNFDEEVG